MRPIISAVVPGHNVSGYVSRALASLINQTYGNLEIIFVNDASDDGTLNAATCLLEACCANYRIINLKTRRGVSEARNAGIKAASGEFITFLDADDFLGENIVEALYEAASAVPGGADVTLCGYSSLENSTGKVTERPINKQFTSQLPPHLITQKFLINKIPPAHCYLCKTAFLRAAGLSFTKNCAAGEDGEFITKALAVSRGTAICHETGYFYVQHNGMGSRRGSVTEKIKRYKDHTEAQARTAEFIISNSGVPELTGLASSLIAPGVSMRRISSFAMAKEEIAFRNAISRLDFGMLFESRKCFLEKPEVFLRALILFAAPGVYYRHYAKRFK